MFNVQAAVQRPRARDRLASAARRRGRPAGLAIGHTALTSRRLLRPPCRRAPACCGRAQTWRCALRTGETALQIAKEKGHTECVAAVKTFLGEVAAERRDAAAVEAGGAGAGSASGGSSGPVPENIGEAGGAGADGDAASGKGAAAAPIAASSLWRRRERNGRGRRPRGDRG